MKKLIFASCFVLMTAGLYGCKGNGKVSGPMEQNQGTEDTSDKTYVMEDNSEKSLSYETKTIKSKDRRTDTSFDFTIDYPTDGPDNLVRVLRKEIFKCMGEDNPSDLSEKGLNAVADEWIRETLEENQVTEEDIESGMASASSFEGKIKMSENTDNYVTYNVNTYIYMGGVHGMPMNHDFTIDKKDCKVLGFNDIIQTENKRGLKALIKSHLISDYYDGEGPDWDGMFNFDLPSTPPAITSRGVVFHYAPYEIDCFAAGMPTCVIPFDEMNEYITDRIKDMIR